MVRKRLDYQTKDSTTRREFDYGQEESLIVKRRRYLRKLYYEKKVLLSKSYEQGAQLWTGKFFRRRQVGFNYEKKWLWEGVLKIQLVLSWKSVPLREGDSNMKTKFYYEQIVLLSEEKATSIVRKHYCLKREFNYEQISFIMRR